MRTILLFVTVFLLMSSVGIYASNVADEDLFSSESSSQQPYTIGYNLEDTEVTGITVTWVPVAVGDYKIEATTGDSHGVSLLTIYSMDERTDIIPIDSIEVKDLKPIEVAISGH